MISIFILLKYIKTVNIKSNDILYNSIITHIYINFTVMGIISQCIILSYSITILLILYHPDIYVNVKKCYFCQKSAVIFKKSDVKIILHRFSHNILFKIQFGLCFTVYTTIHSVLYICEFEHMVKFLFTRCDTSWIFAH